jgi:glucose 1-dehydrogenase
MRLTNKVAVITGANRGIGQGIAGCFAAEGAHVVVNYLPGEDRHAEAEVQVAAYPSRSLAVAGDVSIRRDMERLMEQTVTAFGRVDIAVNNAGIEIQRPFLDVTDEEWNQVLAVNLFGAFVFHQIAARQMVNQGGGGRLINISSVHEDIPFPHYAPYCVSKGGMRMLMRNAALELAPHKITVNNIAPGAIATKINQAVLEKPEAKRAAISEIPWGRFGAPAEVAAVAVFLASDAAEYVTGSTYYVDGGMSQQVTLY